MTQCGSAGIAFKQGFPKRGNLARRAEFPQTVERAIYTNMEITMQTNSALFVSLLYRLKSFRNTTVLTFLLEVEADKKEYACSALVLSHRYLGNQLSQRQVEKAIKDLVDCELITIRVHANTKTYFKVNAEQVLSLLRQPLPDHLPGMDDLQYPFLASWAASQSQSSDLDSCA